MSAITTKLVPTSLFLKPWIPEYLLFIFTDSAASGQGTANQSNYLILALVYQPSISFRRARATYWLTDFISILLTFLGFLAAKNRLPPQKPIWNLNKTSEREFKQDFRERQVQNGMDFNWQANPSILLTTVEKRQPLKQGTVTTYLLKKNAIYFKSILL